MLTDALMVALAGLLRSKKFVAGAASAIVAGLAHFGFNVPIVDVLAVLSPVLVAIAAQFGADFGKEAAAAAGKE